MPLAGDECDLTCKEISIFLHFSIPSRSMGAAAF
jgi:hypothetical protein